MGECIRQDNETPIRPNSSSSLHGLANGLRHDWRFSVHPQLKGAVKVRQKSNDTMGHDDIEMRQSAA
jgi:hypothetical protein